MRKRIEDGFGDLQDSYLGTGAALASLLTELLP
jgi:hypothetical protein